MHYYLVRCAFNHGLHPNWILWQISMNNVSVWENNLLQSLSYIVATKSKILFWFYFKWCLLKPLQTFIPLYYICILFKNYKSPSFQWRRRLNFVGKTFVCTIVSQVMLIEVWIDTIFLMNRVIIGQVLLSTYFSYVLWVRWLFNLCLLQAWMKEILHFSLLPCMIEIIYCMYKQQNNIYMW